MNCKKCGYILTNDKKFCPSCGEPNEFYNGEVITNTNSVDTITTSQPAPTVQQKTVISPITPMNEQIASPIPSAPKKKNIGLIILIISLVLIIVGLGTFIIIKVFGGNNGGTGEVINNDNNDQPSQKEVVKADTVSISGYKFTVPTGFTKISNNNINYIGNNDFYFSEKSITITNKYTYEELVKNKYELASQYANAIGETYGAVLVDTYGGKEFLIISFNYTDSSTNIIYNYDIAFTDFNGKVFKVETDYIPNYMSKGYSLLAKFVDSGSTSSSSFVEGDEPDIYNDIIKSTERISME